MLQEDKYFRSLSEEEIWERYCGFFDLSLDEFMQIQEDLLMEEIDLVADSILGKKIMGSIKPTSVEEFRRLIPLTTYEDYEPYLSERRDDALAAKPLYWCHSAGRGGNFKWVPQSSEVIEKAVRSYIAGGILSACGKKGEIKLAPGARVLVILAPPPYSSGSVMRALTQRISWQITPSLEEAEATEFQERIRQAFQSTLKDGVDFLGAIASVLVRMGEEFTEQTRSMNFSISMLHPKVASRLFQAWLRSKREKRGILPKDVWRPKGILVSGVDTAIYKDMVTHYWGVTPQEIYGGTEGQTYAMQSWNRKGMVFLPDFAFLEFIPYNDSPEDYDQRDEQPSTLLLNEVEEGKLYEVVITHFYGMPLLRYRLNDVIKVIAMKDDETGIKLPHIVFQRRVGEEIGLAGLARLDEKIIWQAIANTGIKHSDWAACKEYDENQTFLRLYIELKEERDAAEVATMVDEQLKKVDTDYKDIHEYLNQQPVRVTIVSPGTFQRYMDERIKEGANLAHLKPSHINPPEALIQELLQISEVNNKK